MEVFRKLKFFQLILFGCSTLAFRNNPSILWDSNNPIFQTNYSLAVLRSSKIKIVCPNHAMVPTAIEGSVRLEELYENLWIVDKQAYETCAVNTSKHGNKILMKCDTPLQLRYFSIAFRSFSALPDGLVFEPGKEYFFIATSNGQKTSLDQTSGGRCVTHNMRIKFYVCNDANDPKCQDSSASTVQPTQTVTLCPSPTQTIYASSIPTQPHYSSATPDKEQVSELLNYTRLIPEIFNHTSQLTALWAQVKNMSEKLNAVQEKLENCSFGGGTGHGTLQTTILIPTTSPMPTTTPTTTPTPTEPVYVNCTNLYSAGYNTSGVYNITPGDGLGSFPVYCDQTTAGGGWTVLQRRFDGSVRFSNRTWVEYQNGFGKVSGEYWLGLDRIHRLAKNPVTLRFDLGAPDGRTRFAVYQGFTVAGAGQKYLMSSGTYIDGDAGDSFSFESGSKFSTMDQDNDRWKNHCAKTFKSGWWHGVCHKASLNGLYLNGSDTDPAHLAAGITWHSWTGYKYFLTKSEMKIRP